MKLLLLGYIQISSLMFGITLIASVAPEWPTDNYWIRILVGAIGLGLFLFGLTMRDLIREATHKQEQR